MILAAVGVGYVLGGGLFSGLTGGLLRLGFKVAALPFVKQELLSLAKDALQNARGARDVGPTAATATAPAEPPKAV